MIVERRKDLLGWFEKRCQRFEEGFEAQRQSV